MHLFIRSTLILFSVLIVGCKSTPEIPPAPPQNSLLHQDSTVYFANKKASVSMRASFSSTNPTNRDTQKPLLVQTLAGAYKLQFRSIQPDNLLVDQVSIVVGGKKIAITEGSFFVPANKGITLSLSLEDTQFIAQHNDATLRFKADNISQLIMIKDHKISEFSLTP